MNPITFKTKFAAACLATAIAGTGITITNMATAHSAPAAAVEVSREHRATKAESVDQDADRYAEREAVAEQQKAYQGGNMIVVGISTTAAIVILVLALLLI